MYTVPWIRTATPLSWLTGYRGNFKWDHDVQNKYHAVLKKTN